MLEERFASRVERSYFLNDLVGYGGVVEWLEEKGVRLNGPDEHVWQRRVQQNKGPVTEVWLVSSSGVVFP